MVAAILFLLGAGFAAIRPSNDRGWVPDQKLLPHVEFMGDTAVLVRNVRNFRWTAPDSIPRAAYYDSVYDLRRVQTVSYIVTPFSKWRGAAHTFVSFGFDDSTFVGISVEARKEVGETYSIAKGLLKRFEVIFVVADERDLIPLRANKWVDEVEVYPVRATPAQSRAMLVGMLRRAQQIETRPEYYGSFRNNCTTNILDQANRIVTKKIRYGYKVLLPGYSDELAMDLGLLQTELSLEDARRKFRVNERSTRFLEDPLYSVRIRE